MAIFTGECKLPADHQTKEPFLTQDQLDTSILFDNEFIRHDIIQHIDGMEWEVNYYNQERRVNDPYAPHDVLTTATLQSYNKIKRLILYTQSPIPQGEVKDVTGEAIIDAGFTPNIDDVFITELLGGRIGIFEITQVDIKTYNLHNAYFVSFKLKYFADTDASVYNNIATKVTREYTYNKDYMTTLSSPIILSSDYDTVGEYRVHLKRLMEYYINTFLDKERKMLVPLLANTTRCYDPILMALVKKVFSISDTRLLLEVFFKEDPVVPIGTSIYTAIINRDIVLLDMCKQTASYTPVSELHRRYGIIGNIAYPGIDYICTLAKESLAPPMEWVPNTVDKMFTAPVADNTENTYVFSRNFYDKDVERCGILERETINYLRGGVVTNTVMDIMLSEYMLWSYHDQYYGIPILVAIIKNKMVNLFSPI